MVIPWRRSDLDPAERRIIVTDGAGTRIRNLKRGDIARERGEVWFEPSSGPGTYYVYYLPYVIGGRRNYPQVTYPAPADEADPTWLAALPDVRAIEATTTGIESVDAPNSFEPMGVIATRTEVDALLRSHPGATYLVFPKDRSHHVKMRRDLPKRWVDAGVKDAFSGAFLPWYTQVA